MTGKEFVERLRLLKGGHYHVLAAISNELNVRIAYDICDKIATDFDAGIGFVRPTEYMGMQALFAPPPQSDHSDIDAELEGADELLAYALTYEAVPLYLKKLPREAAQRIAQGGFLAEYYSPASWSAPYNVCLFDGYCVTWKQFEDDWNKYNPEQEPISGILYLGDMTLMSLRREKGMTQKQVAEVIGVAQKDISRWETGSIRPGQEYIKALADVYCTTEADIAARLKP